MSDSNSASSGEVRLAPSTREAAGSERTGNERTRSQRSDGWRGVLAQVVRLALIALIVGLIRQTHHRAQLASQRRGIATVELDDVRTLFPAAESWGRLDATRGSRDVLDGAGEKLGWCLLTSPESDRMIGFSGPTTSVLGFDTRDRMLGSVILTSGDTREHVDLVRRHPTFLAQWRGRTWDEALESPRVDAVSGATLTSLAIAEGWRARLGAAPRESLKFPEPVEAAEVRPFFPTVDRVLPRADEPSVIDCVDGAGQSLGYLVRTSPSADGIVGYQGPTDCLLAFDASDRAMGLVVRRSYDNEPYVGYVRDEAGFLRLFAGRTLEEVAKFDPRAAGVEGVSGATMTSQAIAAAVPRAAQTVVTARRLAAESGWRLATRDVGTLIVLGAALVIGLTDLRGRRRVRLGFSVVLVFYLGFINGDLLSQAFLVGVAQQGFPWYRALGLTVLTVAAFVVPLATKRQIYCQQICPFGAAQQLLLAVRPRRWPVVHIPRGVARLLEVVPLVLLFAVLLAAMRVVPLSLVDLEPFDAFLVRVAGPVALTLAGVALVANWFVPMGYCRFGCPTGAVLGYVRSHRRSGEWTRRDAAAVALVVVGLIVYWTTGDAP